MKKILFILLSAWVLFPAAGFAKARQDASVAFRAAQRGDVRLLGEMKNLASADVLFYRDANRNNIFHEARDLDTFAALEQSFCAFYAQDCQARVNALLEEKNALGETPLRRQLNFGRADVYVRYLSRTQLYAQMARSRKAMLTGGLLAEISGRAEAEAAVRQSRDSSGLTDAQMAYRLQWGNPAMSRLVKWFERYAPYML